ncbi:SPOR domain-containing protein [Bordetella holmesii]|uniref:Sporulation and cell division repeat protein n=2 Tax=Bordetella holmesii TaxID=35814 RepID=A0A158MAR6_9BORD|nr:SPOR domain-containing protein [Bordetella holmesii]AIT26175.1 sporulation related domain protein [Bordetella holmesii 44057]EWM41862.1 sporulation related domain protein [Bordetella holmesii 41130]EWM46747.1 sporulation related domain protein [Bordetella holmesii 35009]EWM50914.1 sporulation related domain protein [Bordetella holmesii 70147]AMD45234.1 cell division protein [Bordetella holmesii H558]
MASKRKSSSQGGSTLYGVLAGLLIGLILAAGVAFYVTKAPVPFVDRATRQTSGTERAVDPRDAPDPNQGLYGRDGAAGTAPTGPTASAPTPLADGKTDDLGALIASLPSAGQATAPASLPVPAAPPAAIKPATTAKAPEKTANAAPSSASQHANGNYYLQAGAYRGQADAESLRARILLLGLPVNVTRAEVNGVQINRVRVGPFARLDDMNRARSRLGEDKIESTVVKQQ